MPSSAHVEDVLTVVEQEQHVAIGQVPPYRISRRVPRRATNVENPRRLSRNVFDRANRGEIDQPDTVGRCRARRPRARWPFGSCLRRPGRSE